MLVFAIVIILVGSIWFVLHLLAIRKYDRIRFAMYDYRREIMDLMRSNRIERLEVEDYRALRKTLERTNLVIEDFEKTRPNVFAFVEVLKRFGKRAYRADVLQERQKPAQNDEVKHQQSNFRKLLSWSVYYPMPFFFRNRNVLTCLMTLFGCRNKSPHAPKGGTYSDWLSRNVSNPLARDFSPKH